MVRRAARVMTAAGVISAVFAFARLAKRQRRCAEDHGAGNEKGERSFHALPVPMAREKSQMQLVDGVTRLQREGCNLNVELFAASTGHLVCTPH
jgi:hypothetical protein